MLTHKLIKVGADIVTETDKAVEKMVSSTLGTRYPDFDFIGEETYAPGVKLTDRPTFICDPIDGTTNFVHNFRKGVCISLGLAVERQPVVGVVYNPFMDELYTAIKGRGAFLTSKGGEKFRLPLKAAEPLEDLSSCLIGAEWGSDRSGVNFDLKCKVFAKLAASKENGGAMCHSLRCIGSAALNICLVACGEQDIFWEGGCWSWDVCAGWVILAETGGIMMSGNPGEGVATLEGRKYLAVRGAPSGQEQIIEEMYKVIGDGRLDY